MTGNSSKPTRQWEDTIHHEVRMLRHCAHGYGTPTDGNALKLDQIVYLECFLLHYRNLVQFLSGNGRRDDLKIDKLEKRTHMRLTKEQEKTVSDIKKCAAAARKHYRNISTHLSHCSWLRHRGAIEWDLQKMLSEIEPAIKDFEKLFPPDEAMAKPEVVVTPGAGSTASTVRYGGHE